MGSSETTPNDDTAVNLSEGTFGVTGAFIGGTFSFSFTVVDQSSDPNNQRLAATEVLINVIATPIPTVTITNTTDASESGTDGVFTIEQSAISASDIDITYSVDASGATAAAFGTDYTLESGGAALTATGTITIPAGDTSVTITVSAVDDAIVEVIVFKLDGITGSAALSPTVTATNTIIDDDAATVTITNSSDASESGIIGSFTIELSAASTTETEVFYEVDGATTAVIDTDYSLFSNGIKIPVTGSLIIPAGGRSVIITVMAVSDTITEGDEDVVIRLTSVTSASGTAVLSTVPGEGSATSTIIDATLSIANEEDTLESGTDGLFTVTQSEISTSVTVVSYTVAGSATAGVDYSPLSGSVEIPAGQKTATILVSVIKDTIVEEDETVVVTLTGITSGSATLDVSVSATNTIVDDDADINEQVAAAFQGQVHNYVSRRMKLQSRSSPSIHRNSNSGVSTKKNLNGNIDLNGSETGTTGSFSFTNSFDVSGVGCEGCTNPYFWAEAEFAYFRANGPSDAVIQSSGNYYIGYAGLSLPVDERLTVGLMGQIDRFEDKLDGDLGQASGTGWAVGPYFSAKVLDNLNFDIRGLWGRSSNKTNQIVLGSDFAGSFDTERWIVEGILSGKHDIDEYSFIPSARLFYMNENWDDYSVSDGNRVVAVGGDSAEIGNLSAALEINKTVKKTDFTIETFVSGEIYWDFQDPGIIDTTGAITQSDDFSASISAGIGFDHENSSLRLEATYSGLGNEGLESFAGSISLSHKF